MRPSRSRLDAQLHTLIIRAIADGQSEVARQRLKEHARATFDVMVGVGRVRPDDSDEHHEPENNQ
ncbi:hypothetical protein SD72_06155 [Leucobacter komagatae]|uniref:Uncharacterized protein n=1 Tax=Leucobacter komagatae TaxID=55969 RepID=A0A0D0IP08_9MICO|nr:hypothetical protein SD72_06155 [Leucobacter komagatae]